MLDDVTEVAEPYSTSTSDEDAILTVSGLTKVYPDGTLAVDDIDFSVEAGNFCVIIGPSGCGKSTTLHSIVGKVTPTDGSIVLDGADITNTPTYQRDIGLVFQDFQLLPHLTVAENVRYGLERMKLSESEIEERVAEVLSLMNLEAVTDRPPEELSAGQKQRVALARSIVLRPKLLLLDEPLGDMDYKLQKRMERELLRIHRELDTTFVYVTHDQTQAMRLADQIVVMNAGKIEQSGSVDEVYNRPVTAFVATFIGDSNTFYGEISGVDDDRSVVTIDTAFGTFLASTRNLVSDPESLVGEKIPFAVRPQQMDVSSERENAITAALRDVIHQPGRGFQIIAEITDADGRTKELEAKVQDEPLVDEANDQVTFGWDTEDSILLETTSVVPGVDLETDILGE